MSEIRELSILVVDDEPDLAELLAFEFELLGANVKNAANGREAFEWIKKNPVDVVISDIRMPGGDGVELLDNLKQMNQHKPVLIFMTGFADLALEDAYDKGAAAMFGKPFNRNELLKTVSMSVLPLTKRWHSEWTKTNHEFVLQEKFKNWAVAEERLSCGQGGFFFGISDKLPATNDLIKFSIQIEEGPIHKIEGEGVVRWVRRQEKVGLRKGVGVEIRSVLGDDRNQFINMMQQINTKAFIPR